MAPVASRTEALRPLAPMSIARVVGPVVAVIKTSEGLGCYTGATAPVPPGHTWFHWSMTAMRPS